MFELRLLVWDLIILYPPNNSPFLNNGVLGFQTNGAPNQHLPGSVVIFSPIYLGK